MRMSVAVTGAIIVAGSLVVSPSVVRAEPRGVIRTSVVQDSDGRDHQSYPDDRHSSVRDHDDRQPPDREHDRPPTKQVPEPSTLLMVGGGLLLAFRKLRKREVEDIPTTRA